MNQINSVSSDNGEGGADLTRQGELSSCQVGDLPNPGVVTNARSLLRFGKATFAFIPMAIRSIHKLPSCTDLDKIHESVRDARSTGDLDLAFIRAEIGKRFAENRFGTSHPYSLPAYKEFARSAFEAGKLEEAVVGLNCALRIAEGTSEFFEYEAAELHSRLALVFDALGEDQKTKVHFETAERLAFEALEVIVFKDLCCDSVVEVFSSLAHYHTVKGEEEKAAVAFSNAIDSIPRCLGYGEHGRIRLEQYIAEMLGVAHPAFTAELSNSPQRLISELAKVRDLKERFSDRPSI